MTQFSADGSRAIALFVGRRRAGRARPMMKRGCQRELQVDASAFATARCLSLAGFVRVFTVTFRNRWACDGCRSDRAGFRPKCSGQVQSDIHLAKPAGCTVDRARWSWCRYNYLTNSFFAGAPTSTIVDPFKQSAVPLYTSLFGVSFFSANDGNGLSAAADHLIVAFNDSYATSAIASQSDFTNLFPGFDERAIIAAADRVAGIGDENLDAAYTTLFGFSDAVHANGADFTLGSSFTLVSFSSGLPLELAPRTPPLRA